MRGPGSFPALSSQKVNRQVILISLENLAKWTRLTRTSLALPCLNAFGFVKCSKIHPRSSQKAFSTFACWEDSASLMALTCREHAEGKTTEFTQRLSVNFGCVPVVSFGSRALDNNRLRVAIDQQKGLRASVLRCRLPGGLQPADACFCSGCSDTVVYVGT